MTTRRRWQAGATTPPPTHRRGLVAGASVLRGHLGVFAASLAFALIQQLALLTAAVLGGVVVVIAVTDGSTQRLGPWLVALAASVLVRTAAMWCEAWLSHDLAFRLLADIRVWVYRAVERLAPGGLDDRRTGELASTAMADSERLELLYAHALINVVVGVVVPGTAIVALATVHGPLAAALTVVLALAGTAGVVLPRRGTADARALRDRLATVRSEVHDTLEGAAEIATYGQQDRHRAQVEAADLAMTEVQVRQASRTGVVHAIGLGLPGASAIVVVITGLLARPTVDAEVLLVAAVLATAAATPVVAAMNNLRELPGLRAAADRVFALLDAEPPTPDDGSRTRLSGPASIRMERVDVRYGPDQPLALRGIDLEVTPGETLALVGRSGAGKSTLATALLRHLDVDAGAVLLGGVDVRDHSLAALRDLIAHVPQETFLFHDTIAANLRLGAPGASDEQLERALDAVGALGLVRSLPDGLDTLVGDRGARLSGGQRQRIALARVLLRDRPILVLDEAVSHLDLLAERDLHRAFEASRRGRTTVVIAHRVSTIRAADRVAVLERGRLADVGTHEVLLERCATYRELLHHQVADDHRPTIPTGRR
ncbi:MAG: ABC transporter ATP-binding protein [Nitriliruptoraceae bacterium]|nr:ABC transporter ATP-binding protein [Nitriliruptoraceae bacterium]